MYDYIHDRLSEWNPISKLIPGKSQYYFVTIDNKCGSRYVTELFFDLKLGRFIGSGGNNVIAWMPFLPEPYKE